MGSLKGRGWGAGGGGGQEAGGSLISVVSHQRFQCPVSFSHCFHKLVMVIAVFFSQDQQVVCVHI